MGIVNSLMAMDKVYQILRDLSIEFKEFTHPPVFTVEQAEEHWKDIDATHCKNLFFRDKKGRRHFLVVLRSDRQLDIRALGEQIGAGRLSFGSVQRLDKYLGLTPGSVSPFGLINDNKNEVEVYIDEDLKSAEKVGFHPNDNSITIVISSVDFRRYLEWVGNDFRFIALNS